MHKFMILFQKPLSRNHFETIYNDFLGLVERMPNIRRRQVVDVVGSPLGDTSLFRVLEVYFDDQESMEAALRSKAGQEAGGELRRFKERSYELIFAEVYEEEGGQTPEPEVEAAASEDTVGEESAEGEADSAADAADSNDDNAESQAEE